jgi:hypothetical protein
MLQIENYTKEQNFAINELSKFLANSKNLKFMKDADKFIMYESTEQSLKTIEIENSGVTLSCDRKNKTALLNIYNYSDDLNFSEIANIFLSF